MTRRILSALLAAALLGGSLTACAGGAAPASVSADDVLRTEIDLAVAALVEDEGLTEEEATVRVVGEGMLTGWVRPTAEYAELGYSATELSEMIGVALERRYSLPFEGIREELQDAGISIPVALAALADAIAETGNTESFDWVVTSGLATQEEAEAAGVVAPPLPVWGEPAGWEGLLPEMTGMKVEDIRFAVGHDGAVREASIVVTGPSPEAAAWLDALPDVLVSTHRFLTDGDDYTEITLSSGADVSPAAGTLPAAWTDALPLGPAGMQFAFAGTKHRVRYDGGEAEPPSFRFQLAPSNRINVYEDWIAVTPGWTITSQGAGQFTAENDDFEVFGMLGGDRTDELTITAKRWDVPGLDALRP